MPELTDDDQDEKQDGGDLDIESGRSQSEDDLEKIKASWGLPAARDGIPSAEDIADKEENPGAQSSSRAQQQEGDALNSKAGGGFYKPEGDGGGRLDKLRDRMDKPMSNKAQGILFGLNPSNMKGKLSKRSTKILFGVGLGGTGLFLIIGMLIILFATLKIPNLAEHIASYQLARTTRTFRQSLSQVNAEKIAVDSVDDGKFSTIKQRYEGVRSSTWGKLDKWRPTRTYKNMQATGRIDYRYSEPNLLGRQKLQKIVIDGVEVDPTNRRFFHPYQNYTDKLRLAGQLDANIAEALKDRRSLIRGSVAKKIRADLGIKLHWWEKQGKPYKEARSASEANLKQLRESEERISATPEEGSLSKPIQEGVDEAKKAQEACIKDDGCAKSQFLSDSPDLFDRTFAETASQAATNSLDGNKLTTLAEAGSLTFAVAQPICIIYDGSVERSGATVDAANKSLQRTFYGLESAASQQFAGATTEPAVGAMNRKLGDIGTSIPEKRARNQNQPVSTEEVAGPQASAVGEFTIFSAVLGDAAFVGMLNGIANQACPVLTDWRVGVAAGVGELVLAIVTGGGEAAGAQAAKTAVGRVVAKISENLLSKKAFKRMFTEAGAVAGLTVLAKMIVISRANAAHNGIARGETFANEADMGGNLHGNDLCRNQFYGRPMTQPEVVASNVANKEFIAQQKSREGTFERYLALSNPDSLLVNVGVGVSSKLSNKQNASQLVAGTAGRFSSTLMSSGLFGSLNPFKKQMASAQAATDTNYEIIQWCWTEDELNLVNENPTYTPLENDEILMNSGKKDLIEQKYKTCYTESIGKLLADKKIQRDSEGRVHENEGECSPKKLSKDSDDQEICGGGTCDLIFRWRLSHRNEATLDMLTEIQDPKDDSASGGSSTGETGLLAPGALAWPVRPEGSQVSSCFAIRTHPVTGVTSMHRGVDISIAADTPVFASADGEVVHAGPAGGYGDHYVAIKHESGVVTGYGHNNSHSVNTGDRVTQGQQIGTVGSQGQSTGPHVHYNLTSGGGDIFNGNVDPLKNGLQVPPEVPNSCPTS